MIFKSFLELFFNDVLIIEKLLIKMQVFDLRSKPCLISDQNP